MKVHKKLVESSESVVIQHRNEGSVKDLDLIQSHRVDSSRVQTQGPQTADAKSGCFQLTFEFVQPLRVINDLPLDINLFFLSGSKPAETQSKESPENSQILPESRYTPGREG